MTSNGEASCLSFCVDTAYLEIDHITAGEGHQRKMHTKKHIQAAVPAKLESEPSSLDPAEYSEDVAYAGARQYVCSYMTFTN